MNKQELIKEIEENGIYCLNVFGNEVKSIPVKRAIGLIEQLDEPQPVKVPQCVAEVSGYFTLQMTLLAIVHITLAKS
mgnify:CR=1 FL=1